VWLQTTKQSMKKLNDELKIHVIRPGLIQCESSSGSCSRRDIFRLEVLIEETSVKNK